MDRDTIKAIAQGADNSLDPWFYGLQALGSVMRYAGLKDDDGCIPNDDWAFLGWMIGGIGATMQALYGIQQNAEFAFRRMTEPQPKGEAGNQGFFIVRPFQQHPASAGFLFKTGLECARMQISSPAGYDCYAVR